MSNLKSDMPKPSQADETSAKAEENGQPSAPQTPTKRRRGRPKKGEEVNKITDMLPKRRSDRRLEQEKRERELELERQKQEELERQRMAELEAAEAAILAETGEMEDLLDAGFESATESPKKQAKIAVPRTPTKKKARSKPATPLSERRTKKGRPSKQENVTKQVSSIFQMDKEIFTENTEEVKPKRTESPIALNFDNQGASSFSRVPTISGVKSTARPAHTDKADFEKFIPLPIPNVDENGEISDAHYISEHLSDVSIQFDASSRLTDERAFFLEGSEGYFEQHSLRFRPSASSLASNAPPLEYEEFIPMTKLGEFVHHGEKQAIRELQRQLYHQFCFEISQGYSLNFYGVGSKTNFLMDFVEEYLLDWYEDTIQDDEEVPSIMVINGYNPGTKLKTVIHDIVSLVVTEEDRREHNLRMPKHVSEALPFLISFLKKESVPSSKNGIIKPKLILVIHSIDGEAFRDERSQNYLSQLASLETVWLVTSTDNVNASLLWDLYRYKNFNFLWHDATSYAPYSVEMSFKDVLSIGRSKKFVGSKGAKYVLTSLTLNAKNLYKNILEMQLAKLAEHSKTGGRTGLRANVKLALEARAVYEKCVDQYIVSNELNFNTMLGEYVEHKMCVHTKNAAGTEIIYVPFTYDEMEKLLAEEF